MSELELQGLKHDNFREQNDPLSEYIAYRRDERHQNWEKITEERGMKWKGNIPSATKSAEKHWVKLFKVSSLFSNG